MAGITPSLTTADIAFRLLVENVQDYAIFMLDPNGYIMTWNRGAQRAKGYAADEIIGKHFSIFYTQPDIDRQHPQNELRIAMAEGRYEEEGWRVRKDGTHFWANVVITAVYDDDGNHIGFGKVTRDLSERRAREQREMDLQQERVAADASNRAKTTFLTTMSHELRTPLNAIVGYIDLLEAGVHGTLTAPQLETLQRVRRSSKLLLALINDVLNIARIEAGQVIYRTTTFPLSTLLNDLETLMGAQFRNAGLDFVIEPAPAAEIHADYDKTQQIFLNLLSNSLKFTPRGGAVRVAASLQGSLVTINVTDTGRGIPEDRLVEIFEPFVQVDRVHTPESLQGVGLGLSISRDLARGMGGDITARSAVNEGATFIVTLPKVAG